MANLARRKAAHEAQQSPCRNPTPAQAIALGTKRAIVALARKLGVVLHRIWVDGSTFRCAKEGAAMPALITAK
jgi:hypothetical protein